MFEPQLKLLNDFQRDFPLHPRPWLQIAQQLGVGERELLSMLVHLKASGVVSRVGAVFRPNTVGVSTLAAMPVPAAELERVAALVSRFREVNHNYQREHRFSLWFVATAADEGRLGRVLEEIERLSGYPVMALPLVEDYHLDLGFDLHAGRRGGRGAPAPSPGRVTLSARERALVAALQEGLPPVTQPYAALGRAAGMDESDVVATLARWSAEGVIRRLGIIVRHHELGWRANAMVVWDVPDERVSEAGRAIARHDFVTLCYRRPRRLPDWPYNLFCMIHGRDRDTVLGQVRRLARLPELAGCAHEPLFSVRRYKQTGACYASAAST